ncbi:MAG: CsbD family protein [Verrucomicrobia bacterium]|nr:CsbD family protein [Verrucomicrobiota bacterium]
MEDSTKDKVKGNVEQASGKVKEKVGQATNDPDMQDEGTAEKVKGKVQEKVGDIKKVFEK